jgi:MFS family permease
MGRVLRDAENLSWVVTAYLLAATAVTPLFGKLSDIHGRRIMMLIAIAIFIAGSVVCALAPNMAVLIAGRALQGIGGGGLMLVQTIIGDVFAADRRATRPTPPRPSSSRLCGAAARRLHCRAPALVVDLQ